MFELFYIIGSYLLGTCMTAWFVGRMYGVALQTLNSGNLGARNAGRTLGKSAFTLTALGDALKGVVVVTLGRKLGFDESIIALGMLAVVLGHIYPFWLKWKGGMAVATIMGSLLVFNPTGILAFLAGFLLFLAITRSLTLSMVVGFFFYGVFLIWWNIGGTWIVLVAVALVIWKHRDNIRKRVRKDVLE